MPFNIKLGTCICVTIKFSAKSRGFSMKRYQCFTTAPLISPQESVKYSTMMPSLHVRKLTKYSKRAWVGCLTRSLGMPAQSICGKLYLEITVCFRAVVKGIRVLTPWEPGSVVRDGKLHIMKFQGITLELLCNFQSTIS